MSDTEQTTDDTNLDAFASEFFGTDSEAQADTPQVEANDQENVEDAEQEAEGSEDDTQEQEEVVEQEENQEQDPEIAPEPKPKKTVQERIDELVRQREDAKREAAAQLETLRKEFEEKLAALQATKPEAKADVPGEPTPDDTNEDGTAKYELGEFDPQYIRDLTRYTLEQERTKAAEQSAEEARINQERQAQAELATKWNEKVEATKAEYPDFMEKGQQLIDSFSGLDESYGQYLSNLLMSMDKGPEVLYYLSSNPSEAVTIVNSGAQRATLALGRIEAKFLEADAQKTLARPKTSKAPPPPPPNARSRGANGAFVGVSPDTDDLDAFTSEFFKKK